MPAVGTDMPRPRWDPPLRKPDVAVVTTALQHTSLSDDGAGVGQVNVVARIVAEAVRLGEDVGVSRVGLLLHTDEFIQMATDACVAR